jgi:hypothetical protein
VFIHLEGFAKRSRKQSIPLLEQRERQLESLKIQVNAIFIVQPEIICGNKMNKVNSKEKANQNMNFKANK